MATVKKNNKKKIIVPICIILVIAIVVTSVIVVKAKNSGTEVALNTITTSNITESVNATGEVSSGAEKDYKVSTVATVKEVFVKTGDKVKEGDMLATFDTTDLDAQVKKLQSTYNESKSAYNKAVASENAAKAKLNSVNSQIAKAEKQVANAKKAPKTTKKTTKATTKKKNTKTTTKKATTTRSTTAWTMPSTSKKPTTTTTTATTTTTSNRATSFSRTTTKNYVDEIAENLAEVTKSLKEITETITQLTDDINTMNQLLEVIAQTAAQVIASGELNPDKIAEACGQAVSEAIKEGIIDETKLIVDSGVAVQMVEKAVKSVDWSAVAKEIEGTPTVQQTSAQLQLAALYAEKEIFSASSNGTVSNAQKSVMNTAKEALDVLKDSQAELQAGWKAAFDGTITECDLKAGEQSTLVSKGIKLENTNKMVVTISLGEYDIHKVKVGMAATISTAYGKYNGEIATIAPTATGGSSSSIMDSVGSMAGISGLSSLTDSGAGVECTVTVDNPDSNIIVGFDADVQIITGTYNNVTSVPIESISLEKDGKYVYLYNEKENTVTKTAVTTGATSDTAYQVTSGLKVGDKIVATPASDYKEDTFKVKVVDKATAKAKAASGK